MSLLATSGNPSKIRTGPASSWPVPFARISLVADRRLAHEFHSLSSAPDTSLFDTSPTERQTDTQPRLSLPRCIIQYLSWVREEKSSAQLSVRYHPPFYPNEKWNGVFILSKHDLLAMTAAEWIAGIFSRWTCVPRRNNSAVLPQKNPRGGIGRPHIPFVGLDQPDTSNGANRSTHLPLR